MASTAREQYLLELINEARLDPLANAKRYITSYANLSSPDSVVQYDLHYFKVHGKLLHKQLAKLDAVQPVAWNDKLAAAARAHNHQMIKTDTQAHDGIGDGDFGTRLQEHGYGAGPGGENIDAYSTGPLQGHAALMVDWGFDSQGAVGGMQNPPGHRINIMGAAYREVGAGVTMEHSLKTQVGPNVITEDFGAEFDGPKGFILGVAYHDKDKDGFYSMGEGLKGLHVALAGQTATSTKSGGYSLPSDAVGAQTITLTGGGLHGAVKVKVDLGAGINAKLDVIDGDTLHTSVSAAVSGKISTIEGLGTEGLTLAGGKGGQSLIGTAGADTLTGGKGHDTFVFDRALKTSHADSITDFKVKQHDSFQLEHDVFTKIDKGHLGADAFHEGTKAHDKSDRIIYDDGSGKLFYDADGSGKKHAVEFAAIDAHLKLSAHDFLVA